MPVSVLELISEFHKNAAVNCNEDFPFLKLLPLLEQAAYLEWEPLRTEAEISSTTAQKPAASYRLLDMRYQILELQVVPPV